MRVNSIDDFKKIADDFAQNLLPKNDIATIVGLYGDLGAGKTTFTQYVAKVFGITEVLTSPTFVIMKIYDTSYISNFEHFIHIDAYRLEKSEELLHLGWKDIISDPKNLILIEWPERVADIMPEHVQIHLSHISENGREMEILNDV